MDGKKSGLLFAALLALTVNAAAAQDFPSKSVRFIVPFPPAGAGDTQARAVAQPLSRALGQSVVVENRTGANTLVATELVARTPADGHTILMIATSFTVNPFAYSKLPYDAVKDFIPVTRLAYNPLILCVHPSLPVKTVKELVALARAARGAHVGRIEHHRRRAHRRRALQEHRENRHDECALRRRCAGRDSGAGRPQQHAHRERARLLALYRIGQNARDRRDLGRTIRVAQERAHDRRVGLSGIRDHELVRDRGVPGLLKSRSIASAPKSDARFCSPRSKKRSAGSV